MSIKFKVGGEFFEPLRNAQCYYVDKTELIYDLVSSENAVTHSFWKEVIDLTFFGRIPPLCSSLLMTVSPLCTRYRQRFHQVAEINGKDLAHADDRDRLRLCIIIFPF